MVGSGRPGADEIPGLAGEPAPEPDEVIALDRE
jgi:hypothetical protein